MANKKHAHEWLPISHAVEESTFNFKAKDKPGAAKPRGYEQPKPGDAVLWSCQYAWSEYDDKTRKSTRHYCAATLTHPEMWRLKNRGEFTERSANAPAKRAQTAPPAPAQSTPAMTPLDKLRAAREAARNR